MSGDSHSDRHEEACSKGALAAEALEHEPVWVQPVLQSLLEVRHAGHKAEHSNPVGQRVGCRGSVWTASGVAQDREPLDRQPVGDDRDVAWPVEGSPVRLEG